MKTRFCVIILFVSNLRFYHGGNLCKAKHSLKALSCFCSPHLSGASHLRRKARVWKVSKLSHSTVYE